ncbi:pyridoxal phosphate-dependent aminotransferase [Phaeobacter inhibens]|uniref:MalY/PatB family protein n=1 Tax=Phaeobacter inhibens TaxID=221822 RepID=UPI0001632898|nr:MalY/PatB family protein [Phaeobacter inhibens]AFO89832.1 cystathionine beta-lyase PatB [Phaeobacter inhibens DSM 17395]AUQ44459.1 cystathionine beta-lyase PatB [Phaeobacter inhibens]AXT21387.1 pyridoxal phosphate-dependent aminotransferase [Phaeobacter inhibens]
MNFDKIIDRRNTHCIKWDMMEDLYNVPRDEGLSMWVADMDFAVPSVVTDKMREMADHGVYGYVNCDSPYKSAICWWMQNRHGWSVDPEAIFTTTGLVNGVGMCLDTFTQQGDGIVLFTPVYHAFAKVIRNAGREVVECELAVNDGRYEMDFSTYDAQMTGAEKMVILCSPHNPVGRVWTEEELRGVADFAKRHDLILLSDEIHHDLVFDGATHIPMQNAAPDITDRLLMLTAPSKTFNFAGMHTGQVIIPDPELRAKFSRRMMALALSPNSPGQWATAAAYSPEGAAWVDELVPYLDGNRQLFDAAVNEIPGLHSTRLEATYLAWVDFSGTGMSREEFTARVEQGAKIAANHGPSFGTGGENFLRFNLGTQRARVEEACDRLRNAFSDLQ